MKHSKFYLMTEGLGAGGAFIPGRPADVKATAPRHPGGGSPSARSRAGHKHGEWSAWLRAGGVEYRYRWGLNPRDLRHAGSVDAMFQVRNLQTRLGDVRSLVG